MNLQQYMYCTVCSIKNKILKIGQPPLYWTRVDAATRVLPFVLPAHLPPARRGERQRREAAPARRLARRLRRIADAEPSARAGQFHGRPAGGQRPPHHPGGCLSSRQRIARHRRTHRMSASFSVHRPYWAELSLQFTCTVHLNTNKYTYKNNIIQVAL